ncbi:MAG: hypothetical protein H8E70_00065, partial [Candidatus Marinimicrobia bacterium]|nr:hypothetical protein [Candidatus Neomarinimicrobiota bacterium]
VSYLKKGSGIGSDPNDNYSFRDKTQDDNTPFLLGIIDTKITYRTNVQYRMTDLLYLTGNVSYNDKKIVSGRIGFLMNY